MTTNFERKKMPAASSTYKKLAVQWLLEALRFVASLPAGRQVLCWKTILCFEIANFL